MDEMESFHKPSIVYPSANQDCDMKQLMAGPVNVELVGVPLLRDLDMIIKRTLARNLGNLLNL